MPVNAGGPTLEELERKVEKALLKRTQTLREIAERIGKGVTVKQLCRPIAALERRGAVAKHKGRPPRYSKS